MLTTTEKQVLTHLVKAELAHFSKERKSLSIGMAKDFLKAEHEYVDLLRGLIDKLK